MRVNKKTVKCPKCHSRDIEVLNVRFENVQKKIVNSYIFGIRIVTTLKEKIVRADRVFECKCKECNNTFDIQGPSYEYK